MAKKTPAEKGKPIPLHIEMRRASADDGDHVEHDLTFGIVGADEPAAVSVLSERYLCPVIVARDSHGGLRLCDQSFDTLALTCFRLMAGLLLQEDGESGWWTIADVTKLIRKAFRKSEATEVIRELFRHVNDGPRVRDVCLVADDNSI